MAQPPHAAHPIRRRDPRYVFDALVGLVIRPEKLPHFGSRSTDISQGGIGLNLIAADVKPDEVVSLQIPLPKQHSVQLRASLRYRIGLHCGFAFVDLDEGQRSALKMACEALAGSQSRESPPS